MISEATGLKRASLYHRFPDGKSDMELAVIDFTQKEFMEVLAPLDDSGPVKTRIRRVTRNLDQYYESGLRSCLIDSLSVGTQRDGRDIVSERIAQILEDFIGCFAKVACEAGANPREARRRAEDAVVRFEGSLVVARCTGNTASFRRWMKELPQLLTGED